MISSHRNYIVGIVKRTRTVLTARMGSRSLSFLIASHFNRASITNSLQSILAAMALSSLHGFELNLLPVAAPGDRLEVVVATPTPGSTPVLSSPDANISKMA